MSIEYHDPRATPSKPSEPYALRADFSRPLTVGLLANGFPDSAMFLEAVEGALAAELPAATFRHYGKRNASIPASPRLVDAIVAECDAVVAAYGH